MTKKLSSTVLLTCMFLAVSVNQAKAYTLDGSLSDWGVNPFWDWSPSGSTADWIQSNNSTPLGGAVSGGEYYDLEAMYFDNDNDYIYFAMVTSLPQTDQVAGDLGFSLDSSPGSEYGLSIRGMSTSSTAQTRIIKLDPNWNSGGGQESYMEDGGTAIGTASVIFRDAGFGEWNGTRTYILEGAISRTLFGALFGEGAMMQLHYAEACGNDWLDLSGDVDGGSPSVPEPSTVALLIAGLAGAASMRRVKKS